MAAILLSDGHVRPQLPANRRTAMSGRAVFGIAAAAVQAERIVNELRGAGFASGVRAQKLRHLADDAVLGAVPNGSEQCGTSFFCCLSPDAGLSYCWQPTLRILVRRCWCQWWEAQH